MDIKKIKELIRILENSQLEELELEDENGAIRLAKARTAVAPPPVIAQPPAITLAEQPQGGGSSGEPSVRPAAKEDSGKTIKSPMVGTFYASPSPEAAPFVKEGDKVKPGDVLCIIEAMKTMNKITSDTSGKVRKIMVENGSPVEFGQPLFIIE